MKRPWQVWFLFSLCMLVALAAMAWLTVQTLHVDRQQQQAQAEAELEQQVGLVLWRMDTMLAPIIAEEAARPSEFFRPRIAANGPGRQQRAEPNIVPDTPSSVILNFNNGSQGQWSSPQVPSEASRTQSEPNFYAVQLKKLSQEVDISDLLSQLPQQPLPVEQQPADNFSGNSYLSNSIQAVPPAGKQSKFYNKDLQQRNRRLQEVTQQAFRKPRNSYSQTPAPTTAVVQSVSRPVWMGDHLLLACRVDRGGETEVHGSWLDWPRLEKMLLAEAADVLPQVELIQVGDVAKANPARMLATLPVELVVTPAEFVATVSPPTRWALSIGWGASLVAAAAVALLLRGVMALSERRAAFVSAVTHELRTPLTTFRMYSEMLAKDMVPDAERRREYLDTLQRESQRLTHLVENVLSYARLERGRGLHRREQVAATAMIERMQDRLTERAEQADMQLVVTFDEGAAEMTVTTDLSVVEQILFNLVDNAAKYAAAAEDRRVHLAVSRDTNALLLTVTDHGPGFATRTATRQPFGKSAEEAAISAPGVGLGLALCRRLATQLGGSLQVAKSAGPGARVTLQLPVD